MTSPRRSGRRWSSNACVPYDSSADVTKKLTLIRNATLLLELDDQRLLVDPMLDDAGARPAVENTDNDRRNPLVPLPIPVEEIVRGLDAVLVTHLHRDHFDDGAVRHLPRHVPLYCQPEDEERLRNYGFDARPVHDSVVHRALSEARLRRGRPRSREWVRPRLLPQGARRRRVSLERRTMSPPTDLVTIDHFDERRQRQLLALFQSAWWTARRQPAAIARMLDGTDVVVGLVDRASDELVGFARVITDRTFLAVVLDVIVEPGYRGRGCEPRTRRS
jgi:Beta-lactamase superfamily domain